MYHLVGLAPPPNQSPVDAREEFDFWGRQAVEHALFMHLGLEDAALKKDWYDLYQAMNKAYEARNLFAFMMLLDTSMAKKRDMLRRLISGEWLGWLFPAFVDHVRREEENFVEKIQGNVPSSVEAARWIHFMAEHAEFASHLVDTTERQAMLQALALADQLHALEGSCMKDCSAQILSLSARKGQELDRFFTGTTPQKPLSVIHPVLRDHVIREGRRFVDVMNRLWAGKRATVR